jgi:hypothetical protein
VRRCLALGLSRIGDFGLFAPVLVFLSGLAVPSLALLGQAMLIPCVVVLLAMSVDLAESGRVEPRMAARAPARRLQPGRHTHPDACLRAG